MATYEYEIIKTGEVIEVDQRITDAPHTTLEVNGEFHTVRRLISTTSFHLKGNCWAKDGYRKWPPIPNLDVLAVVGQMAYAAASKLPPKQTSSGKPIRTPMLISYN